MNEEKREIKKLYTFMDITGKGGKIVHVFPTKQRMVAKVLDTLPDTVEKMYVFGSSITLRCGEESDVDICLIGNMKPEELRCIKTDGSSSVDFIVVTQQEFDERKKEKWSVYDEIAKKGLLIYERGRSDS